MSDYICITCKHICFCYDNDYHCDLSGEIVSGDDTCDCWTDPDEPELTEDEKADIRGDQETHRRMVED